MNNLSSKVSFLMIDKLNPINFVAKVIILKFLNTVSTTKITVYFGQKVYRIGNQSLQDELSITIHDIAFFQMLLFGDDIGMGKAYARGYFEVSDLTKLLTILAYSLSKQGIIQKTFSWISLSFKSLRNTVARRNSKRLSKDNIHAHYDIGNDLFFTFLDKNKQYSSAIYTKNHDTLELAQLHKMATICKRLRLKKNDRVLEIGSGWGGLAIYMAKNFGCHVTTITISEQQYTYAKARIQQENLQDLIDIRFCDYRDIQGSFTKIASIEMIEAVGRSYYHEYFDICSRCLEDNGLFCMQAILFDDARYKKQGLKAHFINHFIFPGSQIPSLNVLNESANKTGFVLQYHQDITSSYVKTLAAWQDEFNCNSSKLASLGYDSYFQRLWNFYFSFCQAGFIFEQIRDAHLIFRKRSGFCN
jgi:cyclopropane-fatty-acyl-phospholipid synthase